MPIKKSAATNNHILSLRVSGGFLDGLEMAFSSGLNCIIGARGAGKTTVLELIRYAMDSLPDADASSQERKRISDLIEHNLDGGSVRIAIQTQDGSRFIVNRPSGEPPIVLTEDGSATQLSVNTLFKPHVYSQSDIEMIADQPALQLALIDRFESEKLAHISDELRTMHDGLRANASKIVTVREKIAGLDEQLAHLPVVQEQLQKLASASQGSSKELQKANDDKALRQRESSAVTNTISAIDQTKTEVDSIGDGLRTALLELGHETLEKGPNGPTLQPINERIAATREWLNAQFRHIAQRLESDSAWLRQQQGLLTRAHADQEAKFRTLLEQHRQMQGPAQERARLENQRHSLQAVQRQKDDLDAHLRTLEEERKTLLNQVSDLCAHRYAQREKIVQHINNALMPEVEVSIENLGNQDAYQKLLSDHLKGTGANRTRMLQRLTSLTPAELAQLLNARDTAAFEKRVGLNRNQAEKAVEALGGAKTILDIEAVALRDRPIIKLNDNGTYKSSPALSKGQKCTAVLPILLLDSDRPLLIDQPEDNLDNRFISKVVVDKILKVKQQRQLFFVTHNPSVVVLAESERVFVLNSSGTNARIVNQGSVDDCKIDILSLLEGGAEAFEKRRLKYGRL